MQPLGRNTIFSAMISNKNDNDDDDDCLIRIMVVALCCARSLC